MKKRGFTLIELLAVIVILAIIALIAVPIIMNIIDRSKGGVYDRQRDMVAKSAELYYFKYNDELVWEDDISYVEIGRLKETGYLREKILNPLNNQEIPDETKVLIYKEDGIVKYSLQLYDNDSFKWYQQKMVESVKSMNIELPTEIGEKTTVDLDTLINEGKAAEIRIPTDITNRCVGYVEVEKIGNDNYAYEAYVDCLLDASTFASHYVSYGGKYLDEFNDVKETTDGGYVAVGRSNSEVITKYGIGNNGMYDAIIVKFDSNGNVLWSKNFGGSNNDIFNSVLETADGYVAVGSTSSEDIDIDDYKGGPTDAIIVKFNKQGNVVYKRTYGGTNLDGGESFNHIMIKDNKFIISGNADIYTKDGDYLNAIYEGGRFQFIIMTMDFDFNILTTKFHNAHSYRDFKEFIATDNGYIGVATYKGGYTSYIFKLDNDMEMVSSMEFYGGNNSRGAFNDIVEVSDGYIVVGHSNGFDLDMTDLSKASNGYNDAVIVKYDKNLQNIIWKKSFGGSNDDVFYAVTSVNANEVVAVGYSKSEDMDMSGLAISKDGYSNAVIVKYSITDGSIVSKKIFGGNNSDIFRSIIKTSSNRFILAGQTFSSDGYLKNFNKGHSDAILVGYDMNFNLSKIFQEPVVIIEKLKTIVSNYGTDTSLNYSNIFTSNNPEVDLSGWCSNYLPNGESNYPYGQCLRPFNSDDMKLLNNIENNPNFKIIYQGENEYPIINEPNVKTNWYQLYFRMQNDNTELSSFKIKFEDGYIGSIEQSVSDGYIEPLVVVSNILTYPPYSDRTYNNLNNILFTDGKIDGSSYPVFYMNLKSRQKKIDSFIFTSNRDVTGTDRGISIYELRNFDMSITPTN